MVSSESGLTLQDQKEHFVSFTDEGASAQTVGDFSNVPVGVPGCFAEKAERLGPAVLIGILRGRGQPWLGGLPGISPCLSSCLAPAGWISRNTRAAPPNPTQTKKSCRYQARSEQTTQTAVPVTWVYRGPVGALSQPPMRALRPGPTAAETWEREGLESRAPRGISVPAEHESPSSLSRDASHSTPLLLPMPQIRLLASRFQAHAC